MRVRMLVDVSGTRNGKRWPNRGSLLDVSAAEGSALVAAGIAERVSEAPRVESATLESADVETAVVKSKPARKPRAPRKDS